jgi:hypothetical protein
MIRRAAAVGVFSVIVFSVTGASAAQAPANKACGLVTESELQSALGAPVVLKAGSMGAVQTCAGEAQSTKVLLRFFTRTGAASGKTEQAGVEALKKMGAQVEVQTSGGITCMTTVPPASMAATGFGTSCTMTGKAPTFAVLEVTAKAQKDMVPIAKLRAVAEKMASRF